MQCTRARADDPCPMCRRPLCVIEPRAHGEAGDTPCDVSAGAPLPVGFATGDANELVRVHTLGALELLELEAAARAAGKHFEALARPTPDAVVSAPPAVIHVPGLLSASDVAAVLAAADALEAEHGPQRLRCHGTKIHTGGAHSTLYLHHDGWWTRSLPQLAERLPDVMRAQWAAWLSAGDVRAGEHAARLTLRCVEVHSYSVGGALATCGHFDAGSCVTLSVLLSESTACAGGAFVTWSGTGAPVEHPVERGDALLFASNRVHNVAPVVHGERRSLVIELWEGAPLPRGRGVDLFGRLGSEALG